MYQNLILISLCLILGACSPHSTNQPSSTPEAQKKSIDSLQAQPLADYVGIWARMGTSTSTLLMIDASYNSDDETIHTVAKGLDASEAFGYTFLAAGDKDTLELAANPETGKVESLARKPVNGKPSLFEISYQLISPNQLHVEIAVSGKVVTQDYLRAPDWTESFRDFYQKQNAKAISLLRSLTNVADPGRCKAESMPIYYAEQRSLFCLKAYFKTHPEAVKKIDFLTTAIERRDSQTVDFLIEQGMDVNAIDSHWKSPVDTAILHLQISWPIQEHGYIKTFEQEDILRSLAKAGADFNLKADSLDESPFCSILGEVTDASVIELMVEHGADVRAVTKRDGAPCLYRAFISYRSRWLSRGAELIQFLLDHGADPNVINAEGMPEVLYWAAQEGDVEALKLLKSRGAKFDLSRSVPNAAIHAAEKRLEELKGYLESPEISPLRIQGEIREGIKRLEQNIEFLRREVRG